MKLKELLETVHQLADRIGQARMEVKFCNECNGKSQEEHREKHLQEAIKVREKLPYNLVWRPESLRIKPIIKLLTDEEGHVIVNLEEVEII